MAFKMKGSPMKRNFGVGSPLQQAETAKRGKDFLAGEMKPNKTEEKKSWLEKKADQLKNIAKGGSPMKQDLRMDEQGELEGASEAVNTRLIQEMREKGEQKAREDRGEFKNKLKEGDTPDVTPMKQKKDYDIKEVNRPDSPMKQWYKDAWDELTQLGVGLKEFGKEVGSKGSKYGYQGRVTKNPFEAFADGYRAEEARDAEDKDDYSAVDIGDALWAFEKAHGTNIMGEGYDDLSDEEKVKAFIRKEKAGELDPGGTFHSKRNPYK